MIIDVYLWSHDIFKILVMKEKSNMCDDNFYSNGISLADKMLTDLLYNTIVIVHVNKFDHYLKIG